MIEMVITGTLIGAGFASGKEIYLFFYRYGFYGFIGIIICSILLGILLYKILSLSLKYKISNYSDFLSLFIKNKLLKKSSIIITNVFLLLTFFVMIAGFGAYLNQEFGVNYTIGIGIISVLCFFIFLKGAKGVEKVSSILVPVLIFFIFFLGIKNIKLITNIFCIENEIIHCNLYNNWFIQALLYCSYNLYLLIPVLINFTGKLNKKKVIRISINCMFIIFALLLSIFVVLSKETVYNLSFIEMPVIYLIEDNEPVLKVIYGIIISFSIITTAISEGIGFIKGIKIKEKNYWKIVLIMCILGILVSYLGFTSLVQILYPVIGLIGIIQIIYILKI